MQDDEGVPSQTPAGVVYPWAARSGMHCEEDKAEAFVDTLENQCKPNFDGINLDHAEEVDRAV